MSVSLFKSVTVVCLNGTGGGIGEILVRFLIGLLSTEDDRGLPLGEFVNPLRSTELDLL